MCEKHGGLAIECEAYGDDIKDSLGKCVNCLRPTPPVMIGTWLTEGGSTIVATDDLQL
jgi:hypothetical protein